MHRLNNPKYIEDALKKIKREFDTKKYDFTELTSSIRDYIGFTPISECKINKGTFLARARTKQDNIPYNRLSKITLRQKEFVKSFGRAHVPNQAIFYCSTNDEVAIREATQWHITDFNTLYNRNMLENHDSHKKFVTVSIWKVVEDIHLASLFLNEEVMNKNTVAKYFGDKIKNEIINEHDGGVHKSTELILEFFSNEFAKKTIETESDYLLSAYYANEVYLASKNLKKLDGVTYSTIALDYQGENIAITQEAYKKKIEFETAYHAYVANIASENSPMMIGKLYKVVDCKDDIITWLDLTTGMNLPIDETD